ncbi:MAG: glycosyltransferase family 39 protein [Candidatus Omnitrophica bacterium]|nr:glycosyltransferase family 39 protein [Candidatus Omnitrophota bacterium]
MLIQLDNGRLWQDEAETAVLGRNILQSGYPSAWDGTRRLNPSLPVQEGNAWTYHTWLPMYLAAGSFLLLGPTTWAARLPFALLGIGALWLTDRLVMRLWGDRLIARLTVLSLTVCVPFLLHMRQCRYYAPAVFFTLWATLAYWRFLRQRGWASLELIGALTALFHSDHGAWAPVAAAFFLHFAAIHGRSGKEWRRSGAVVLFVLALTVPWIAYLQAGQHHQGLSLKEVSHHFQFYLRQINRFLLPVFFWLIAGRIGRRFFRGLPGGPASRRRQGGLLIGLLLGVGFLFLVFLPEQRHFRYLIFLVPFLLIVQAALLAQLWRWRWKAALGLALLLFLTDLIQYSGPSLIGAKIPFIRKQLSSPHLQVRLDLFSFLGELSHPYRGPVDGIIELLQKEGRAGQTVKAPYEEHPILFYTPLLVEPILRPEDFSRETYPEWIILRRDWLPAGFLESAYYGEIQSRYERRTLDSPDIPWQNRPDPGYHRFRTDREAPPVVVFHRK